MGWLLPPATALVIVVLGVLVLTTPLWMHPALDASGASALGISPRVVSDLTVDQLLLGGDFLLFKAGGFGTFYTADERAHLRDAQTLLWVGIWLALASLVLIVWALRHRPHDARRWRSVARGGAGLAVGVVVVGVVGYFAFDPLFELFHRVFFPGGNWEFPADSNMIRLYPYAFWQLTAAALGVWCVLGGGLVWWLARRRAA